jgi:predicted amidohydrolase YtcJ
MKKRTSIRAAGLACGAILASLGAPAPHSRSTLAAQGAQTADLVLRNGRIVTVDERRPEAQAIAIRGDRIVAVGTGDEIAKHVGPRTEVIDLAGQLAIPGFIEGHAHFTGIGQARLNLNLTKAKSWDEIVAMVGDAAKKAKPGEWIFGRGWHQEKWDRTPEPNVEGFPIHDALSKVSPDNPVLLTHASGHAAFANAKAMVISGVTKDTKNPAGGEILRDANGNPTGALVENADELIRTSDAEPKTDAEREARTRRRVELASEEVLSKGVTTVQDAGSSFETIDVFRKMAQEGRLPVRLWVMVRENNDQLAANLAKYRTIGAGHGHLTVRAIKVTIDGALGSRGAWLLEPYSDLPSSTGLNTVPVESVRETARLAMQHDYQFCVHAIGDRANREVLDIFEQAFRANPDKKDRRWRIEHAQHLHPADIPRFGQLGVIASMQGIHCTSDAPFVVPRLGAKRAEEGAYVWAKLAQSGALIVNGTDAPVEDVDPIASYYASVTRRQSNGQTFYPDQKMSRMEALRSYTINAAKAAFEEDVKGSLAPGKLADITVLTKDITTVSDTEILSARVAYTIVGGKVAYKRPVSSSSR